MSKRCLNLSKFVEKSTLCAILVPIRHQGGALHPRVGSASASAADGMLLAAERPTRLSSVAALLDSEPAAAVAHARELSARVAAELARWIEAGAAAQAEAGAARSAATPLPAPTTPSVSTVSSSSSSATTHSNNSSSQPAAGADEFPPLGVAPPPAVRNPPPGSAEAR